MEIDFEKLGGLVPAIIQDASYKERLDAWLHESGKHTIRHIATKKVTFWSRSRNCLWTRVKHQVTS